MEYQGGVLTKEFYRLMKKNFENESAYIRRKGFKKYVSKHMKDQNDISKIKGKPKKVTKKTTRKKIVIAEPEIQKQIIENLPVDGDVGLVYTANGDMELVKKSSIEEPRDETYEPLLTDEGYEQNYEKEKFSLDDLNLLLHDKMNQFFRAATDIESILGMRESEYGVVEKVNVPLLMFIENINAFREGNLQGHV